MKLLDDDGYEVADGSEGAICVTGLKEAYPPGLFVGYYNDPERTAEPWVANTTTCMTWHGATRKGTATSSAATTTSSSARAIASGRSRWRDALVAHPAVVECAVTAAPDPRARQGREGLHHPGQGYEPSDELTKLQDHVKHTTAPYKYPRIVEYVDDLPKTIGGKIKRKMIRNADGGYGLATSAAQNRS